MKICRDNPDDARKVFDDDTYQALMEVRELEEAGDFAAAEIAFGAAYEDAPSLQGCGATCRLEVAGRAEREVAEARGLEVYEMSGALYVDKTWTCPGCGKTGGLRGGNGIICMGGCGADVINGVRHEKSDYSSIIPIEPKERERPWWKSFARVQAEFEANQARKQSATSR